MYFKRWELFWWFLKIALKCKFVWKFTCGTAYSIEKTRLSLTRECYGVAIKFPQVVYTKRESFLCWFRIRRDSLPVLGYKKVMDRQKWKMLRKILVKHLYILVNLDLTIHSRWITYQSIEFFVLYKNIDRVFAYFGK